MSGGAISRRYDVLLGSSASIIGFRLITRFRRAHLNVPFSNVKAWWIELWLCPSARMAPSARSMSSGTTRSATRLPSSGAILRSARPR